MKAIFYSRKFFFSILAIAFLLILYSNRFFLSLDAQSTPALEQQKKITNKLLPKAKGKFDIEVLLEPSGLNEMVLGKETAPVTIIEYASITCFHCAHFEEKVLPELKKKYIDSGKVRFIFREFPFDPRAEAGFMLARCSGNNYFAMLQSLFRHHETLVTTKNASETLLKFARQAGFSEKSFEACLSNKKLLESIRFIRKKAEKEFKVTSTPTFFINGEQYSGALSFEEISALIESKL